MAGLFHFARCVGRAVVKNAARAVASMVPLGEVVYEITRDAHEEYRKDRTEADLRADLASLAQATEAEIQQVVETVLAEEAAGQPDAVRLALTTYLEELPGKADLFIAAGECVEAPEDLLDTVTSPRRTYSVLGLFAVGDVADFHLAYSRSDPDREEETQYLLKVSRVAEGRFLLNNERQVLTQLLTTAGDHTYRKYLPTLVESFPVKDRVAKRVHVFLEEPGFYTLEQVHEQHPALDGPHLAWIFKRLLTVLGFSHRQKIVHGAILPCHVMLHPANHGLQLVGWGQSVEPGQQISTLVTRYRDWYPPEVLKKQPAGPGTDLFLAARCLIYLAGGEPVCGRMPESVPASMQRFVKCCLLEGPRMRPADAWKLLDEFDEVLSQLYGPPRFHQLTMT